MTPEQQQELRDAFIREFEGTQNARTDLHAKFSEQGVRLIEHRKKVMEAVITVGAAFIAAPLIFGTTSNKEFYTIGLSLLIFTIIFTLLHLKESVDEDEARTVETRNKLLPILERRLVKIKEYLSRQTLDPKDASDYWGYRQSEDQSEDMKRSAEANQKELEFVAKKRLDYPSSLIMLLFTSGVFFILSSIFFPNINWAVIVLVEVLLVMITASGFATEVIQIYAKCINLMKL